MSNPIQTERPPRPARQLLVARLLCSVVLVVVSLGITAEPAQAAANRLPYGQRLNAGECIADNGAAHSAKFCVGMYYNIKLIYDGKVCWSWEAAGHLRGPSSYVKVASNGDVRFYQYSGGRQLWHSGTSGFPTPDLVVGAHSIYLNAGLAVDTGSAYFTFKSCR